MKVIFMGTPDFAVPSLQQLLNHHDVLAVCTQPDRPAGRGNKIHMSPVKTLALSAGVEVLQPETLRIKKSPLGDADLQLNKKAKKIRGYLAKLGADIFVVVAYGIILPQAVLDMPRLGCVNVHASLLPKYRGASPIHSAIKNGDATTGITIMHMDIGVDTGNMILQKEVEIAPDERTPSLHDRMANLGGECIIDALALMEAGKAESTPQDNTIATHAPMIQKTDGLINWAWPSAQINNLIRAFDPWPGPYTLYNGEIIKIWQVETASTEENAPPGTVLAVDPSKGLRVRTGDGGVWILEMQAPGGKRMAAKEYLRGREVRVGEILK
ncbi:MAG: methionyl-tRNA formyltransferase [Defluviitaleaceae bacterium]|nr:methionyl-tRNA formyltransferase [Defluviitaleaceae bacterium]